MWRTFFENMEDQFAFHFTGNVNVLLSDNHQHVGKLTFFEGALIRVKYFNTAGQTALFNLLTNILLKREQHLFVAEPDRIENTLQEMKYGFDDLFIFAQEIQSTNFSKLKMIPPSDRILKINGNFVFAKGEEFSENFYLVLELVSNGLLVREIYRKATISFLDVTTILVSMKKRGIIL